MGRVTWWVTFACLASVTLGVAPGGLATAGAPVSFSYAYEGDGLAVGAVSSRCEAIGATLDVTAPVTLDLDATVAELEIVRTNVTYPRSDPIRYEAMAPREITHASIEPDQTIHLRPGVDPMALAYPYDYARGGDEPFDAAGFGRGASWEQPRVEPLGVSFFYDADGEGPDDAATEAARSENAGARMTPHRPLVGLESVNVSGAMSVYLRGVIIETADRSHDLSRFKTAVEETGVGEYGAVRWTQTDAWLHVRDMDALLVPMMDSVLCTSVRIEIEGAMTLHSVDEVVGLESLTRGGDRDVSMRGTLLLSEEVTVNGERFEVQGSGSGRLSAAAVDHQPAFGLGTTGAVAATVASTAVFLTALYVLYRFAAPAFLYSRIAGEAVLDHPTRSQIIEYVRHNPGHGLKSAAEALGIPRGTARHHVRVLEAAGKVRTEALFGERVLFLPEADQQAVLVAGKPALRFILELVRAQPMPRATVVRRLCERFGFAHQSARRWIDQGVKSGLVRLEGDGKGVQVSCV